MPMLKKASFSTLIIVKEIFEMASFDLLEAMEEILYIQEKLYAEEELKKIRTGAKQLAKSTVFQIFSKSGYK